MKSVNPTAYPEGNQEERPAVYTTKKAFDLTGFAIRTTNTVEFGSAGKIPALWQTYGSSSLALKPGPEVHDPHLIYALYTDYESDASGAYTLVVGHESTAAPQVLADSFGTAGPKLFHVQVPEGRYRIFKTRKGPMSEVVAEAWTGIWAYFEQSSEQRTYAGDFELYDTRDMNPEAVEVLIHIAVR